MDIASSKIISKNIKKLRDKSGLSQDQTARKANMPLSTYLKVENGVTPNPSIQTLLNIAEALEISLDELLAGSRPGPRKRGRTFFCKGPEPEATLYRFD